MNRWAKTVAICLAWGSLNGNPFNPTIVSGIVTFDTPNPQTLRVTASNTAIIQWEGFSIPSGELTKFIQPNSNAAVLNRVTGISPTALQGSLQANGRVFLINHNGILIGASGMVNTSGFLASTLDVLNSEFVAQGDMNFAGASVEMVSNQGIVNGWNGDVVFLARRVDHQGEINAPQGEALIGVGSDILLKASGPDRIFIDPAMGVPVGNGITSSGDIAAMRAELKADGNLYALAINLTGMVDAKGIGMTNGRIVLSAEEGSTNLGGDLKAVNSNGSGGEIQVLGKTVQVGSGASAHAAGLNGGGLILIGGNVPGESPVVYNATSTTVAVGAALDASALGSGGGGTVAVWSEQDTEYRGSAVAEGGAIGGNGGRVRVGGKSTLTITGYGDTLAPFGDLGLMAMEASNLDIKIAGINPPANTIGTALLVDNLSRNQISLITLPGWPGTQDIIFHDPVSWPSPAGLNVMAGRDIAIHASLNYLGGDNLGFFYAKPNRDLQISPDTGSLTMTFPASQISLLPDRDLTIGAADHDFGGVQILAEELVFHSGRDTSLLGGAGMNSSVSVSGTMSCEVQTGGVDAGGFFHTQGGSGTGADVYLPGAEITSYGPNS